MDFEADQELYPFTSHYMPLEAGQMHYIDEGSGEPVVMVHGNPDWSFSFRKVIQGLQSKFRCIALDHIGFGLSDKPNNWSYRVEEQAANFTAFVQSLELPPFHLMVNDWGGPIALRYAINHPANVKSLIIMNSWAWPVGHLPNFWLYSTIIGGPIGQYLIQKHHFFSNVLLKLAIHQKKQFTEPIHQHYLKPHHHEKERQGIWTFAREIRQATDLLQSLHDQLGTIARLPTMLVWGLHDPAFGKHFLRQWRLKLMNPEVVELEQAGHFPQEDQAQSVIAATQKFIVNVDT